MAASAPSSPAQPSPAQPSPAQPSPAWQRPWPASQASQPSPGQPSQPAQPSLPAAQASQASQPAQPAQPARQPPLPPCPLPHATRGGSVSGVSLPRAKRVVNGGVLAQIRSGQKSPIKICTFFWHFRWEFYVCFEKHNRKFASQQIPMKNQDGLPKQIIQYFREMVGLV